MANPLTLYIPIRQDPTTQAAAQAALRFCLSFPAVSTTIPGIMKPLEADQNAAASLLGPLPRLLIVRLLYSRLPAEMRGPVRVRSRRTTVVNFSTT